MRPGPALCNQSPFPPRLMRGSRTRQTPSPSESLPDRVQSDRGGHDPRKKRSRGWAIDKSSSARIAIFVLPVASSAGTWMIEAKGPQTLAPSAARHPLPTGDPVVGMVEVRVVAFRAIGVLRSPAVGSTAKAQSRRPSQVLPMRGRPSRHVLCAASHANRPVHPAASAGRRLHVGANDVARVLHRHTLGRRAPRGSEPEAL